MQRNLSFLNKKRGDFAPFCTVRLYSGKCLISCLGDVLISNLLPPAFLFVPVSSNYSSSHYCYVNLPLLYPHAAPVTYHPTQGDSPFWNVKRMQVEYTDLKPTSYINHHCLIANEFIGTISTLIYSL